MIWAPWHSNDVKLTKLLLLHTSKAPWTSDINSSMYSGLWINIKMSYQYRKSHCGDKTTLSPQWIFLYGIDIFTLNQGPDPFCVFVFCDDRSRLSHWDVTLQACIFNHCYHCLWLYYVLQSCNGFYFANQSLYLLKLTQLFGFNKSLWKCIPVRGYIATTYVRISVQEWKSDNSV